MKINIVKPYLPDLEEVKDQLQGCLSSGMVTNNSEYVRKFETRLKEFLDTPANPILFCNGEMALYHLIQAWKQKMGYGIHDSFEVLVPSFTFSGTVNAIVMNNLKPVFCDIDETLTIDINKIKDTPGNIKMCIAVGVYGNLPDIESLKKVSSQNNWVLLFDNAPAFGSTYNGLYPAQLHIEEIYSFHATKIYTSMEGGAAISHDKEISDYLYRLRDFGQYDKNTGDVDIPGLNSKMQEFSAIIGLKNLEKIDYILDKRKKNIHFYKEFFLALEKQGMIKNMKVKNNIFCPYLYYPIILNEEATGFVNYMKEQNITVRRYYTAVHTLEVYKNKYKELDLELTESIKDKIIALPIHTVMEDNEINHLFNSINSFFSIK